MAIVATGQLTVTDINDAKQLIMYIGASQSRTVIYDGVSTYVPNYSQNNQVLTPQLFIAGGGADVSSQAKSTRWFYQTNGSGTPVEITSNTSDYTLGTTQPKTLTIKSNILASNNTMTYICEMVYTDPDTGLDVTTKAEIEIVKVTNGAPGQNAIIGVLSNESAVIPADANGNVTSFGGAASTLTIYNGATDDTANWTITQTVSGLTVTASGTPANRTATVTGMSAGTDVGTVTFTATRSGYPTVTKVFTVTKSKQGTAGANATAYWLVTPPAIVKTKSGSYSPASITVQSMSQTGAGSPSAYAGRFIIAESTDGTTYTDKYTSSADEATKTYTPSAGIKAVRVRLYMAGGTSTLLDEQTIPVVADGQTTYTWVKYADDANGNGMSDAPDGKRYVGMAFNKTTPTESTNPADYSWSPLYDNVQVGGRNLYRYSGSPYAGSYAYSPTKQTIDGKECLAYTNTNNIIALNPYDGPLEVGQTYTFSFYAKATKEINLGRVFINSSNKDFLVNQMITTEWKRYSFTFVSNGETYNNHTAQVHMYPQIKNSDGTYETFYIAEWKLELGNVSTDWTPAPEDVASDIAAAQAAADAANALLGDLSNDNKLTATEKQIVKTQWDAIVAEKPIYDAQADAYGLDTQKTAYDNAYNTLNTYLTPLLANLTTTSDINGATFRSNFNTYYSARVALTQAIYNAIKSGIDNGVKQGQLYNGTSITPEEGFKAVRSDGLVQMFANATKGFNIQRNINGSWFDQFYVGPDGKIYAKDIQIDGGTIAINDGDITLRDSHTGLAYSLVPRQNLIDDHSFELMNISENLIPGDIYYAALGAEPWYVVGTPRVTMGWGESIFGAKSVIVNASNYVQFQFGIDDLKPNTTYTVSFYARKSYAYAAGVPKLTISTWYNNGDQTVTTWSTTITATSAPPSDYQIVRYTFTFTTPNQTIWNQSIALTINFMTTDANWVLIDGVQLVEGPYAAPYYDEGNIWDLILDKQIPGTVLWKGVAVMSASQTISPSGVLQDAPHGWLLVWSDYDPGVGANNYNWAFSFIPKNFSSSGSIFFPIVRDISTSTVTVTGKYIYTDGGSIWGHDANNQSANGSNDVCLRYVIEM